MNFAMLPPESATRMYSGAGSGRWPPPPPGLMAECNRRRPLGDRQLHRLAVTGPSSVRMGAAVTMLKWLTTTAARSLPDGHPDHRGRDGFEQAFASERCRHRQS